jgi:hypothetical protein
LTARVGDLRLGWELELQLVDQRLGRELELQLVDQLRGWLIDVTSRNCLGACGNCHGDWAIDSLIVECMIDGGCNRLIDGLTGQARSAQTG